MHPHGKFLIPFDTFLSTFFQCIMVGCVLDDILVTLQVNVSLGVVMGMTMKIYETLSKKVTGVFVVEMM